MHNADVEDADPTHKLDTPISLTQPSFCAWAMASQFPALPFSPPPGP